MPRPVNINLVTLHKYLEHHHSVASKLQDHKGARFRGVFFDPFDLVERKPFVLSRESSMRLFSDKAYRGAVDQNRRTLGYFIAKGLLVRVPKAEVVEYHLSPFGKRVLELVAKGKVGAGGNLKFDKAIIDPSSEEIAWRDKQEEFGVNRLTGSALYKARFTLKGSRLPTYNHIQNDIGAHVSRLSAWLDTYEAEELENLTEDFRKRYKVLFKHHKSGDPEWELSAMDVRKVYKHLMRLRDSVPR